MFPDLLNETRAYWRKLDKLEAAYQRGEVPLEEVNAQVKDLMTELGRSRRQAFRALFANARQFWLQQPEVIFGVAFIGVLAYTWVSVS